MVEITCTSGPSRIRVYILLIYPRLSLPQGGSGLRLTYWIYHILLSTRHRTVRIQPVYISLFEREYQVKMRDLTATSAGLVSLSSTSTPSGWPFHSATWHSYLSIFILPKHPTHLVRLFLLDLKLLHLCHFCGCMTRWRTSGEAKLRGPTDNNWRLVRPLTHQSLRFRFWRFYLHDYLV